MTACGVTMTTNVAPAEKTPQAEAATEEEVKKIVAQSIMDYLHELKMPKKVTDFDKARFITDLETFFRREQLID